MRVDYINILKYGKRKSEYSKVFQNVRCNKFIHSNILRPKVELSLITVLRLPMTEVAGYSAFEIGQLLRFQFLTLAY